MAQKKRTTKKKTAKKKEAPKKEETVYEIIKRPLTVDEKFDIILQKIESGSSLRKVLKELKMSSRTFYEWIDPKEGDDELTRKIKLERQKHYARACEWRAQEIFDEILEIADKQDLDVVIDKDGKKCIDWNLVARNKLQIDTRKWALAKMMPRKFGDKLDLTSDGEKIEKQVDPVVINFRNFDGDETKDETGL